jgi:methylthioribose-1-phosphate isomerase
MTSKGTSVVPTLRTGLAHPHPEPLSGARYSAVELMPGDRRVLMLDQRRLPGLEHYEMYGRLEEVAEAIRAMVVRGAPAIGVAAAYGLVMAAAEEKRDGAEFIDAMHRADALLRATRPTAVNLAWALDRVVKVALAAATEPWAARLARIADEARALHRDEVEACRAIGVFGAALVPDGARILTHCNAGALATGGYGTALGVVRAAHEAGKKVRVLATETRPYLQGARLTAWELSKDGIPVDVITDNMVGHFMQKKTIDLVIVGADRIAANGDTANKIGTYGVAVLANAHGVPFYVAAPWSTVDLACPSGERIPIEERSEREVTYIGEMQIVPEAVRAHHPAFDVTPARLVRAIFTEHGTVSPVDGARLSAVGRGAPA